MQNDVQVIGALAISIYCVAATAAAAIDRHSHLLLSSVSVPLVSARACVCVSRAHNGIHGEYLNNEIEEYHK